MNNTNEHAFAQFIRTIGKGKTGRRSLTLQEAQTAMRMILANDVEPLQLGAFLMVLRVKEESAEEIAGFVLACREYINKDKPVMIKPDLDWSSYAGKKRQPPWFLLSALLLAQSGYRVFMHGASGHTPKRLYSEEVLKQLGITIGTDWQQCEQQLNAHNFSFMPIKHLCKPLHDIIELRPLLGLRSPVHTLARLLNPLGADATLQSVFHPSYTDTHHHAAQLLGQKNAAVFKGEGGEVEYRPQADITVKGLTDGESDQYTIPRQSEAPTDTAFSTQTLLDLWQETKRDSHGLKAVLGTTAIALKTMGVEKEIPQAQQLAKQMWGQRKESLV